MGLIIVTRISHCRELIQNCAFRQRPHNHQSVLWSGNVKIAGANPGTAECIGISVLVNLTMTQTTKMLRFLQLVCQVGPNEIGWR